MERQKIENDRLNSGFTSMQSEALSCLFSEILTHVLALIGALTAIITLLLLLVR